MSTANYSGPEGAHELIARTVFFSKDRTLDTDPSSATENFLCLDDETVEGGKTVLSMWMPTEELDRTKINSDVAWSAGVNLAEVGSNKHELYFITPNMQILDSGLNRLDPVAETELVERLRKIAIELGTPSVN